MQWADRHCAEKREEARGQMFHQGLEGTGKDPAKGGRKGAGEHCTDNGDPVEQNTVGEEMAGEDERRWRNGTRDVMMRETLGGKKINV